MEKTWTVFDAEKVPQKRVLVNRQRMGTHTVRLFEADLKVGSETIPHLFQEDSAMPGVILGRVKD